MIVEIDGQRFEVPDDATPEEIDTLTKPAPKPGMGDLKAADEAAMRAVTDTAANIPVGMKTGDPETDRRLAQLAFNSGATKAITPRDVDRAGAIAAGFGAGFLGGALPTFASGALTAGGLSNANSAGGVAVDAAEGGAGALLLSKLLGAAGKAIGKRFSPGSYKTEAVPPRVETAPEAKTLEAAGVDNLTTGQKAPGTWYGNIESATKDALGGMGPERQAAKLKWMEATQNQGLPPGAPPPASGDLQVRANQINDAFEQAYAPFRSHPVAPGAVEQSVTQAMVPGEGYPASITNKVAAKVSDALSSLGKAPENVGDLQRARSYLRSAKLDATAAGNTDEVALLKRAEEAVTNGINRSLPPEMAQALSKVDRQYARFSTSLESPTRGNSEFTPGQYLRSVAKRAGDRNFRMGNAGDLQDLGEAAATVFRDVPATGVTKTILGSVPGANVLAAPVARIANTAPVQRFLFAPRSRVVPVEPSIIPGATGASSPGWLQALADALRKVGHPQVGFAPAMAQEDRQ